jgi:hypothetical protein
VASLRAATGVAGIGLALTEPGLLSAASSSFFYQLLLLAPSWAKWAGSGGGLE